MTKVRCRDPADPAGCHPRTTTATWSRWRRSISLRRTKRGPGVGVVLPASSRSNRMLLEKVDGPRRVPPRFAFEGGQSWGRSAGEATACSRGGLRGQVGLLYAGPRRPESGGQAVRRAVRQPRGAVAPCGCLAVRLAGWTGWLRAAGSAAREVEFHRGQLRSTRSGAVLPEACSTAPRMTARPASRSRALPCVPGPNPRAKIPTPGGHTSTLTPAARGNV